MAIMLPTEPTAPVNAFDLATILLYGPPKIGKSTIAASFPRPLFAACEEGLKFLNVFKVGIQNWEDFIELSMKFRKENHEFRTLIIDTVDVLFKYCQDYVCKKKRIEHPSDEDWGKGFEAVKDEFQRQIVPLTVPSGSGKFRFGLVFLSHVKSVEIKGRIVKTSRLVCTLPNGGRKIIVPMVDIIGYCGFGADKEGEPTPERRVVFEPSEQVETGDKTGKMPASIPMVKVGWYKLAKSYFDGDVKENSVLSANKGPKKKA